MADFGFFMFLMSLVGLVVLFGGDPDIHDAIIIWLKKDCAP